MWDNQIMWQLTEEPNAGPFLRVIALFVASTLSGYLTGKMSWLLASRRRRRKGSSVTYMKL